MLVGSCQNIDERKHKEGTNGGPRPFNGVIGMGKYGKTAGSGLEEILEDL